MSGNFNDLAPGEFTELPSPVPTHLQMADPWAHRGMGMRCRTCMWFAEKAPRQTSDTSGKGQLGRCRKHAPTLNGYPAVFEADWCGDHKLDEGRV